MRHRVATKRLGRPTDQRLAILKSLVAGVLEHGSVTTTEIRAKEARPVIEKVITLGREDSLVNRRLVRRWIPIGKVVATREQFQHLTGEAPSYTGSLKGADRQPFGERLIKKLFEEIGPRYKDRPGGYLRLTALGGISHKNSKGALTVRAARRGDNASMTKIELIELMRPRPQLRVLALTVAYDGTDWAGFQRQTRRPSIQLALEEALTAVLRHPVAIDAAGRTDAGVHALGQVVSLQTANPLPVERIPLAVNRLLPSSIRVRRACEKPPGFHARHSAGSRRYWYLVQQAGQPDPVRGRFCWQVTMPLQLTAMQAALAPLLGQHDFAAFCQGVPAPCRTTVRSIQRAQVAPWGGSICIDVQADAFLHQMMRLLVANLVLVGCGDQPAGWLRELLLARNRYLAGKVAPPHGLFLMRIGYPPMEESIPFEEEMEIETNNDDEEFSGQTA